MKIDQLLNFKCVADERSYTRASEKCFLTQPAIYSQIRQLEAECGTKLFYVSGKEVLLTADGRNLYRLAQGVAIAHQEYRTGVRSRTAQRASQVTIAAWSYFGILSAATEQLRSEQPGVTVNFQSRRPAEVTEQIHAGEVDLGFLGPAFVTDELVFEQCATNTIVVVAPPGHPLGGREVQFEELAAYPLVTYTSGSARLTVDQGLGRFPGVEVTFAGRADNSAAVKMLALAMGAPALIVREAVADDLARGTLLRVCVRDWDASYPLYVAYRSERQLGAAAIRYLQVVRELLGDRSG